MLKRTFQAALATGFLVLATAPSLADRPPTPEERSRIEAALRAEGFTGWGKIEFDDAAWEVDDAIGADGQKYDLKLDKAIKIVKRDRDDD